MAVVAEASSHKNSEIDASDELIKKATGNLLSSCTQIKEDRLCHHKIAKQHCPSTCAAERAEADSKHTVTAAGKGDEYSVPECGDTSCNTACNGHSCCEYRLSEQTCKTPGTVTDPKTGFTGTISCEWGNMKATAFRWSVVPATDNVCASHGHL